MKHLVQGKVKDINRKKKRGGENECHQKGKRGPVNLWGKQVLWGGVYLGLGEKKACTGRGSGNMQSI